MKQFLSIIAMSLFCLSSNIFADDLVIYERQPMTFKIGEQALFGKNLVNISVIYTDGSKDKDKKDITKYVVLFNETQRYDIGFTTQLLYKTNGCLEKGFCVNQQVVVNGNNATIAGFLVDPRGVRYAIRFQSYYGPMIDTGFTEENIIGTKLQ